MVVERPMEVAPFLKLCWAPLAQKLEPTCTASAPSSALEAEGKLRFQGLSQWTSLKDGRSKAWL